MGRKAKFPAILRVEGLSDGRDPTLRDDWTGAPIVEPHSQPIEPLQMAIDRASRAGRASQLDMLMDVGIVADTRPSAQRVRLAHNQRIIRLGGQVLIMTDNRKPKPPWRR